MKKCVLLASAIILVACSKEIPSAVTSNQEAETSGLVTYTFNASIDATKAYIDESTVDGEGISPLKWSEGDVIALYNTTNGEYYNFTTSEDNVETASFTGSAPAGAVFTKAFYPSDYRGEDVSSYYATKYNSISSAGSKKSFAMEVAAIEPGTSSIHFIQKGSLLKFTVSNVPSFTRTAKLEFGDLTESVLISAAEAETGSIQVYFAIPSGTANLTFSLLDDAGTPNEFYTKTRSSYSMELAHLKRFKIALRSCIEFTSANSISKVGIQQRYGTDYSGYGTYEESGRDFTLYSRGTTKYFLLPVHDWTADLEPIRIVIFSNDEELSSTAVFFARNVSFDASENSLKTSYAIFPYNKNKIYSSPTCYVYLGADYKLYMNYTTSNWGDLRIHCWDNGTDSVWDGDMTSWNDDPTVTSEETIGNVTYRVFTFSDIVDNKSFNIIFRGGTAQSADESISYKDYAVHLFGEVRGEGSGIVWTPDDSKTVYRTRLNGDWPGNAITKVDNRSESAMVSIASSYYGQWVKVKFSDNGSSVTPEWNIQMNRDYDYGY